MAGGILQGAAFIGDDPFPPVDRQAALQENLRLGQQWPAHTYLGQAHKHHATAGLGTNAPYDGNNAPGRDRPHSENTISLINARIREDHPSDNAPGSIRGWCSECLPQPRDMTDWDRTSGIFGDQLHVVWDDRLISFPVLREHRPSSGLLSHESSMSEVKRLCFLYMDIPRNSTSDTAFSLMAPPRYTGASPIRAWADLPLGYYLRGGLFRQNTLWMTHSSGRTGPPAGTTRAPGLYFAGPMPGGIGPDPPVTTAAPAPFSNTVTCLPPCFRRG